MLLKKGGGETTGVEVLSAREALTLVAAITNHQLVKKLTSVAPLTIYTTQKLLKRLRDNSIIVLQGHAKCVT
jgi:hypothetical protein